ncbi:FtsX-like permease family protein [Saccharopolyspora antimicrobica]|uniref:FtsX-like permease family protein n=1 Tax=Saccharopolyspora antimicrobica TaxID=455193 RepID=A0A1I4R4U1_9PSEU|nr:ABC transporter permease [Saccharopolyspora antimicrobica]RKT88167.1 FtsX-like permease family protein [Saccharopolyspora antimicrobica]SFM47324.1 FtsX-like permease family protein [Saccharopolyspora antimicrobica]
MTNWLQDLAFGFRLAVTGHRPWGRLVVTALGIALGVAVLLGAAAVPNIHSARIERENMRDPVAAADAPGVGVLVANTPTLQFGDYFIQGLQLRDVRPDAPVAPGVARNPAPGEVAVSPALQELLRSPAGELLRPRLPAEITGVIGQQGLVGPGELFYYAGTDSLSPHSDQVNGVFDHFGETAAGRTELNDDLQLLLALAIAVLLVPIVVYVAATARLAEAARQRRLAAMRLVGATGTQVRRMAAGESLAGAVLGVALGWVLFELAKPAVDGISMSEFSLFSSDVRPVWWLASLVTIGIPALAALVTIVALRRSIAEPLQVTRRGTARPRKLLWRVAPVVVGLVGLVFIGLDGISGQPALWLFVVSVVLVLAGVPLVLPWCVERFAGRLGGGDSTAWQLAVRRLQSTSGTAARSVSSIAVVVTGVIALQTFLASAIASDASHASRPSVIASDASDVTQSSVRVVDSMTITGGLPEDPADVTQAVRELQALPGVLGARVMGSSVQATDDEYASWTVRVADCAQIHGLAAVPDCADGDVFAVTSDQRVDHLAGTTMHLIASYFGATSRPTPDRPVTWSVPGTVRLVESRLNVGRELMVTPAAAGVLLDTARQVDIEVELAPAVSPDVVERVRNIAAAHLVDPTTSNGMGSLGAIPDLNRDMAMAAVQVVLLTGALVLFALIGCSLFVAATEQIQERRRPLAVLGAVGVPRRTMAWSLLLQNAVPMLVATALAAVIGLLLGVPVVLIFSEGAVVLDVPGMLGLFAFAAASVLVVTALSLPAATRAARPDGLRTE